LVKRWRINDVDNKCHKIQKAHDCEPLWRVSGSNRRPLACHAYYTLTLSPVSQLLIPYLLYNETQMIPKILFNNFYLQIYKHSVILNMPYRL